MAINAFTVHWFQRLYTKGVFPRGTRLLELGPQDLHDSVSADVLRPFFNENRDLSAELLLQQIMKQKTAKELYKLFGVQSYKSADYFDRRADFSFDLNYVLNFADKYDAITNFGTAEHCFNVAAVFETIHNLLAIGGISLHILPAFGDINHGFYNIHPLLYMRLAQANNYNIVDFTYADNIYTRSMHISANPNDYTDFDGLPIMLSDLHDSLAFRKKVFINFLANSCSQMTATYNAHNEANVFDYCYIALQKVHDGAFVTPSQY